MIKVLLVAGLIGLGYIIYKRVGQPGQAAQQPLPTTGQPAVPPDSNIKITPAHVVEDSGLPVMAHLPIEGTGSGGFSGWRSGYDSYPDTGNNVVAPGATRITLNPNLESMATYRYGAPSERVLAGRFQY